VNEATAVRGADPALAAELDRQIETLVLKGYPELAGLGRRAFLERLEPLRDTLPGLSRGEGEERIPFVVVGRELVPPHVAIALVELGGRPGYTTMKAQDLERFSAVDGVEIPPGAGYLLLDVDTGGGTLNVTPDEAMRTIVEEGRLPLTIEEGVALVTQYPDVLRTRNCFSMLGSRCGDRRVAALWISGGSPRLGWCWAGAPHTWLGSASCAGRLAISNR
jgi:hypothetical protein